MQRKALKAELVVIGAGSAGLSVAAGAAQLGLRVVLFEKGEMGGDCLNYGCVPSKALIAAADAAHAVRAAGRLGVRAAEPETDFPAVMAHVHGTIAAIAPHDSQERFESLGVRVVREAARFIGPRTVQSDHLTVTARRIVIATGSRARIPAIPGLASTPFLTNETVWDLTALPARLIVLGGGPVGLELGQAFRRLGSEVVIVEMDAPLEREDPELVAPVLAQLAADGVQILSGAEVFAAEAAPAGVVLTVRHGGLDRTVEGSHLLVAAGRAPNLEGLTLEAAGVRTDARGVVVDAALRSSNRAVFALGDVAGRELFTHAAGAHASLFVKKALFAQRVDARALVVPRTLYTDPELASVGLSERQARARHGDSVRVTTSPFADNDRARAEGDVRGLIKLVTDRRGAILGVGIVGRGAGDLIHPWAMAMANGTGLRAFTNYVPPYPTRAEIGRRVAGAWYAPLLFSERTRRLVSLLKRIG